MAGSTPAGARASGALHDAARPVLFASRRRTILLVAAVASAIATAGIATIPFYTRGEPREALVVREIVEGGNWILPLRNGTELPRKPPFFHWLAATAGLALGGVNELTVRLPSALFSVAATLLVFGWASARLGPSAGALTALVTATSFEWMRAATIARVDMVYAALLTAALVSLDRLLGTSPRVAAWRWALYGSLTAAVLTKGPVALVLPTLAVSAVAWARPEMGVWRRLRPGRGLAAVAAIAGSWFFLALCQHGSALLAVIFTENFHHLIATRAGGTGHAHGVPYLMAAAALGLLPWTPLLPVVVPALRHKIRDPSVLLACTWAAAVFAVHSLASAKRPVYLLPSHPALAFLMIAGVGTAIESPSGTWVERFLRLVARAYAGVGICLGLGVLAICWGLEIPDGILALLSLRDRAGTVAGAAAAQDNALLLSLAALAILGTAPLFVRVARARRWDQLITTIAVSTAGCAVIFNTAIHPALARERSMKDFMTAVAAVVHRDDPLCFLGTVDPGIVFYAGRRIQEVELGTTTLPAPSYLLVWERDWQAPATSGHLPSPLKVSATQVPHRGHLLLVAVPPSIGPLPRRGDAPEQHRGGPPDARPTGGGPVFTSQPLGEAPRQTPTK